MLEFFLRFGAAFDWLGPVSALIQNYKNRPAVGYTIFYEDVAVLDILKSKGIKIWGLVLVGDELIFSLRMAQAEFAQYLLEGAGVPYHGGVTTQEIAKMRRSDTPHPYDRALDGIDKLINGI